MFILLFVCRIELLFITNFRKEVCQKLKIVPAAGYPYERKLAVTSKKGYFVEAISGFQHHS
jgi:hypothetical protein